ncbi:putative MFS family arabinose efflux permease [Desulfitobacterium sp. LBE]|uniref:MFS transporter n=1 Tax=Desulfitobacterium sp. LBE TaxID=884086 RepID=UPI00119AFF51|nr:MFS transporter [Desulfitobacterium sp. LBE]TWH58078.1 putative MFS family arabinose efflux permease [Desulfitobacterium sp. LBE]
MRIKGLLQSGFPAFTHTTYRWYWWGQTLSQIGSWVQNVSLIWLVLQLTDSPFLMGVVSALQNVPAMLLSLHAGVLIDRLPRRRILLITQSALMLLSLVMAMLIGLGLVRYWMILVFAMGVGIVNCINNPAKQAIIIELVGREHLTNAIALNSASFNSARLVGPAVAGVLLGLWGATWCFFINGLSFLGVIYILYRLPQTSEYTPPVTNPKGTHSRTSILKEMAEGMKFVRQNPLLLLVIIIVGVISTIGINFNILVPAMAKYELGENALGYGLLMSSLGVGAIVGALFVAMQSYREPDVRVMMGGALGLSLLSVIAGTLSNYFAAAIVFGLMGCCMICFSATANSLIQTQSSDNFRGRVMGVHSLMNNGLPPFGNLYAGFLAELWGAKKTFLLSGLIMLLFLGVLALRKKKGSL